MTKQELVEMVDKAERLAIKAHAGQKDKAGKDYFEAHVAVVANGIIGDPIAKAVAFLHDTVEDASVTIEDIRAEFPKEVADAVDVLTHRKGMSYAEYLWRIQQNRTAVKVKLSDLRSNMDTKRLPQPLTEKDISRTKKYRRAYLMLGGANDAPYDCCTVNPYALYDYLLSTGWEETEKQKEYQKMVETQVNTSIARHKLENMRETIERASVNLLDEAVIEGSERRTYTYSPDGKRDEEKLYHWYNNEWRLDNVYKRIYTYDDQQRCTGRTILDDGREISKVTISYEGGNTIYKYYRIGGPEQTLVADYEKGYDAEKRETLYKLYDERGILRDWREFRYDNEGDQVFTLFWNGSWGEHGSGTKYETIKEGLKNTRTSYQWDSNKNDWWMTETLTILHNEAKRSLSEERYAYNPDGSIIHGEKETNVYDAYNRLTSTVVEEYTNGKFEYSYKEEYTYWGTEAYDPDSEEEDFEGPLLTYSSSDWEDGECVETEYGKIERNAQGVATKGYSKEIDEERIDGEYVFVINEEEGTFDDKGNLIASTGTCKHENGTLLYNIKSEYEYNAQNKNIRSTFYRKYPTDDAWQTVRNMIHSAELS